jgi:hypothetical protein
VSGKFTEPLPLAAEHDVSGFRCGDDSLDIWLRGYALTNQSSGSARTFVTCLDHRVLTRIKYTYLTFQG